MADYSPVETGGSSPFPMTAAAAITGGQLLDASTAGTVVPAAGTLHPIGVAAHDAPNGGRVTVWPISGVHHELVIENSAAVAVGGPITASASAAGRIKSGTLATLAAAGMLLGVATTSGTGDSGGTVRARFVGVA